jgi:hypothetical protein
VTQTSGVQRAILRNVPSVPPCRSQHHTTVWPLRRSNRPALHPTERGGDAICDLQTREVRTGDPLVWSALQLHPAKFPIAAGPAGDGLARAPSELPRARALRLFLFSLSLSVVFFCDGHAEWGKRGISWRLRGPLECGNHTSPWSVFAKGSRKTVFCFVGCAGGLVMSGHAGLIGGGGERVVACFREFVCMVVWVWCAACGSQ